MFALNLGYRWNLASDVEPIHSVVYLPVSNHAERVQRARPPEARRVLFDPQLYLCGLDAERATTACARLATYRWFTISGLPEYDSETQSQREWQDALKTAISSEWRGTPPGEHEMHSAAMEAVSFQASFRCTHIILPSPLISEREDEADTQAAWLDAGVAAADELDVGQPLLATVALDEATLNEAAFEANGFLDTVIDQVASRGDRVDGVYIVVSQTHARHSFETAPLVTRAYLHLCAGFSDAGFGTVMPNFCDITGFLCTAVGATGFATGQSQKLRRLSAAGFNDGGGGGRYLPNLYTHKSAAELLTETDLDLLAGKRLLGRIRDATPHSQPLFDELRREGGTAANLRNWAESQNNVSAAHRHFLHRLARETQKHLKMSEPDRFDSTVDWLESAAANALFIQRRLGDVQLKGRFAPAEMWLDCLSLFE